MPPCLRGFRGSLDRVKRRDLTEPTLPACAAIAPSAARANPATPMRRRIGQP